MFPINDNNWISYIQSAAPDNVNPCWVDIVGNVQYPAAYYYLYPALNPSPTEVAFRMRLNGNPLSSNPNFYSLKDFVWGVAVNHQTNSTLFTILVNASGGSYRLQVKDATSAVIYDVPILLNNPSQPLDNVRVVDAGEHFPCVNPMIPDEDYFLDFTLPTSVFGTFNFASSTYRLCYFTSTQAITINKDSVCGMVIKPPIGTPVLCVTKQIISAPNPVCTNTTYSWIVLITIYNCGTIPVNNVIMTDTLNSSIVLSSPSLFIPNAGIVYNAGTRVVTWNIGTVSVGETLALTINITGNFTAPGHYVLDSGIVTGTSLDPIIFADQGVLVYSQNQLTISKQIVSGPLSIEKCKISAWTLKINVTNTGISDIPNVVIVDHINSSFTVESGPQLIPSAGYASSDGNKILWIIDNLTGNSVETLSITITGFFSDEGHMIFNSGSVLDQCMQTVTFQDTGIDVFPVSIAGQIQVRGDILNCKTNELLNDVSATLYDNACKVIETFAFSQHYELNLTAGTYTVLFEKEGYTGKFLTLILRSDMDITADVNMAPRPAVATGPVVDNSDLDLFSSIIREKIDAEVVYSTFACLNSAAQVDCLNDIVDASFCTLICNSKLRVVLNLEKNLVYKLDEAKNFKYFIKAIPLCYPLRHANSCTSEQHFTKVQRVLYCKDANLIYNIAYIKLMIYLVNENDLLVDGTAMDNC